MLLFKKKTISNFFLFFLFSFSIFSQENNSLDFLDKVEGQKPSKESISEKKVVPKKKLITQPAKKIEKKVGSSKRRKKTVRAQKKIYQNFGVIWINDNIFLEPKFKDFGLSFEDNKSKVKNYRELENIPKNELKQSVASESMSRNENIAQQEFFHISKYIFSIMIEYKKAIIILVLILLLAFFRSRYLKKISNSMKVSKETIILNSKRKY